MTTCSFFSHLDGKFQRVNGTTDLRAAELLNRPSTDKLGQRNETEVVTPRDPYHSAENLQNNMAPELPPKLRPSM